MRLWLNTDSLRMFARPCLPFLKIRSQERCVFNDIFTNFISSHDNIDQRNNACFARLARPRGASIADPAHSGCYKGMFYIIWARYATYLAFRNSFQIFPLFLWTLLPLMLFGVCCCFYHQTSAKALLTKIHSSQCGQRKVLLGKPSRV